MSAPQEIYSRSTSAPATDKRVLVIEGDEAIRLALAEHLRGVGYVVDTTTDGYAGLSMMMRRLPDVVVLDVGVVRTSDRAFALAYTREPDLRQVPLVLLTGRGTCSRAALGLDAHATLLKPVNLDDITAAVRALLARTWDGDPGRTPEPAGR